MFEKYLEQIGLSNKEAEVYVALLQYDSASVVELANKTKVNRTTIYPVLETLAKKGLVSEIQVDKKTHYQAEPPERLESFIERQKVVLEENSKRLTDIIPQLKSIQRESGERPVVKYFEGREGIISSMQDFFSSEDKEGISYLIYPKDLIDETFTEKELTQLREIRLGKNVKNKVLYTSEKTSRPSDNTSERIKIEQDKYPLSCDIAIYKNKVKINILGKKIGAISITNKDFADTMRSLFSLAFDKLKK
ncbi:MAG: helix-turn-helix domain-containing protein [Candidatus Paceibacterota bacterium]|jgi:sugar-specific transcriptional regulator TrmB